MAFVQISGWKPGFCDSIPAIKTIRQKAGIPLNEALDLFDRVLKKESVLVNVACMNDALELAAELERLGVFAVALTDSCLPHEGVSELMK